MNHVIIVKTIELIFNMAKLWTSTIFVSSCFTWHVIFRPILSRCIQVNNYWYILFDISIKPVSPFNFIVLGTVVSRVTAGINERLLAVVNVGLTTKERIIYRNKFSELNLKRQMSKLRLSTNIKKTVQNMVWPRVRFCARSKSNFLVCIFGKKMTDIY